MVPLRAAPGFAAAENETVPLPGPEPPLAIVIHAAFDAAVHAHVDADAVTPNDPDPPASPIAWSDGAMEKVHDGGGGGGGGGAAPCDTVNVFPAIVSVPVRA